LVQDAHDVLLRFCCAATRRSANAFNQRLSQLIHNGFFKKTKVNCTSAGLNGHSSADKPPKKHTHTHTPNMPSPISSSQKRSASTDDGLSANKRARISQETLGAAAELFDANIRDLKSARAAVRELEKTIAPARTILYRHLEESGQESVLTPAGHVITRKVNQRPRLSAKWLEETTALDERNKQKLKELSMGPCVRHSTQVASQS
jgi:hypothetical protein